MSLGLNDLKKRSSPKKSETKPSEILRDDLRTSIAIKPWSNRGLAKAGLSRKQSVGSDHHINEDWIEIQGQSFFWLHLNFDFEHLHEETDLRLQKQLSGFEKKLLSSFDKVKNFVQFIGLTSRSFNII